MTAARPFAASARPTCRPTPIARGAPPRSPARPKARRPHVETLGRKVRDLLKEGGCHVTGGVYSPLDAQIAERVGMKSIYLSGYSMALANGWPDMGFLTQTEVTRIASMVASAVNIPI